MIDEQYMRTPFYGSRRMAAWLDRSGETVNRKRIQRLMRLMGIEAVYTKPRTTTPNIEHRKFPYLLRGLPIERINQVWATDITYVRMNAGFLYLVAIMDWYSRYVLAWRLSNTLDTEFCLDCLQEALAKGTPEIFNSDQGCQFTSSDFTDTLLDAGVRVSMDGKGRCMDNIFTERLWRSYKYEDVYIKDYDDVPAAIASTDAYWHFYNDERPHQSLGYMTPAEVHFSKSGAVDSTQN